MSKLPNTQQRLARVVAFHLPQFHPIPENDAWWGPGFTEWTNVARARPMFPGHEQPLIPGDLGFYDLRLAESRLAQANLASRYGIEAFCYWHYWFGEGKRILERPVNEILQSGQPDFPFCLAWANHSWSGIWDGAPNRMLMEQTYPGVDDERRHFEFLVTAFADHRYFRVDGKPLFYVFRPEHIPDVKGWCLRIRSMASSAGVGELYLVAEVSDLWGRGVSCQPPTSMGFDSGVYVRLPLKDSTFERLRVKLQRRILGWPEIYRYRDELAEPPPSHGRLIPCVYPNWDNTPRSGKRGLVLRGATPHKFYRLMQQAVTRVADRAPAERIVFVKSWNEWAEGNHIEPDRKWKHEWLSAVSQSILGDRSI